MKIHLHIEWWLSGSGNERKKYTDQYVVVKEDCIGHIQKRTNLCKYKKKLDENSKTTFLW